MVIQNHDIHTAIMGQTQGFVSRSTCVDGHQQGHTFVCPFGNFPQRDPITITSPVRHECFGELQVLVVDRQGRQQFAQQGCACQAIDIKVTVHGDFFRVDHCTPDPSHSVVHFIEQHGVVQIFQARKEKLLNGFRLHNATGCQQRQHFLSDRGGQGQFLAQAVDHTGIGCGGCHPGPSCEKAGSTIIAGFGRNLLSLRPVISLAIK